MANTPNLSTPSSDKIFAEDISIKLSVEQSKSDEFINIVNEKIGISAKIDIIENSY